MYEDRTPTDSVARYAGPYERWVFSPELGRPYAFPAISEGNSPYNTALLEGSDRLPDQSGATYRLPPLWNPLGHSRAVIPFAFHTGTGQSDRDVAQALHAVDGDDADIRPRFRVNFPIAPAAWTPTYHPDCDMDKWVVPHTRPKAIIAVIDDGIPFANAAFLDAQGRSRMSHVWLQSAKANPHGAVPFGRELMNGEINALRAKSGGDETALYAQAGAIDATMPELGHHLRRQATHGAHVAGMAAGNAPHLSSHPMGDDIQIIAVQLPNTIAWDTSGFGKEMYMLSAVHYVFDRARAIAAKYADDPANPVELPLVVNFSYGWSASRHDGKSEMELALEELISERKTLQPLSAIVMPTGNNFDQDMHGQIAPSDLASGSYAFGWKVMPDDRTSSYLEIWFPEGMDPTGYTVHVTPSAGSTIDAGHSIKVAPHQSPDPDDHGDPRRYTELEMAGQNIGQLSADQHRGNRWRVMLALIPTVNTRGQSRRAPSGLWRIEIRQNTGAPLAPDQAINIWVQRDDDPASLQTGGKQSRLIDLDKAAPTRPDHPLRAYTERLGFLRGYGTMNGVGSAGSVLRVAGYTAQTGRPCGYSGAGGLTRDPAGDVAPWGAHTSLTAVADQSAHHLGTRAIGVRSGAAMRLIGTSGAAPAAARLMVRNAAKGRPLMQGFTGPLPLAPIECASEMVRAKHAARTGAYTAPPVGRRGVLSNLETTLIS